MDVTGLSQALSLYSSVKDVQYNSTGRCVDATTGLDAENNTEVHVHAETRTSAARTPSP
jgi:hypothetical protein